MRARRLIAVPLAAALVAAAAGPALGAITLRARAVRVLTPAGKPAFVLIPGNRYLFRVAYTVGGAPRIATGHTFVLSEGVGGEQREVTTKTFPPEKGGDYNETFDYRVPAGWAPGVYTFRYTVDARAVGQATTSIRGARSFLVARPAR